MSFSDALSFSDTLVQRLARAQHVAVLTGAGISAESGVPTFRDADGLWQKFRPEELANVRAFLRNPELVQGWYAHRGEVIREVAPNAGHYALAELERMKPHVHLATQNVDGLHLEAGSTNVAELHGNLRRIYCIDCGTPADEHDLVVIEEGEVARCTACGGLLRPDVVWFGEMLPEEAFADAARAAMLADVYLSVGTSGAVYPAAGLPIEAKRHGAYVAEINIQPSEIASHLDETVLGKAGEVLPALLQAIADF
ncbi:MAG: NAD-dependent deacylase [Bacteroidota bacterium]